MIPKHIFTVWLTEQETIPPLVEKCITSQKIKDYEIWPCILRPDVVSSINESHKMIVADAKEKGLAECLIAEDDMTVPNDKGVEWFFKNKPTLYDIYSAGNYLPFEKKEKEGAFRVKDLVGLHFYLIHSRYYDEFLATDPMQHIDTAQKSNLMYVCYPMPVLQRPGFSANNMAQVNYNSLLKPEDIYQ